MYYKQYNPNYKNEDRQFFVPFLLGGLAGAGLVGVSRPRPVYVNPPQYNTPYQPNYMPYRPYGQSGYYNYQSGGYY